MLPYSRVFTSSRSCSLEAPLWSSCFAVAAFLFTLVFLVFLGYVGIERERRDLELELDHLMPLLRNDREYTTVMIWISEGGGEVEAVRCLGRKRRIMWISVIKLLCAAFGKLPLREGPLYSVDHRVAIQ